MNAGHPHAILLKNESDKDNVSLHKLETKGIAIGCFEEAEYKEEQVCLAASNKLYVFSDGVYEITYKNDHEMTLEDFTNIVSKQFNKTDALQSDLIYEEITGNEPDDIERNQKTVMDTMYKLNTKITEKTGRKGHVFTRDNKSIKRNY